MTDLRRGLERAIDKGVEDGRLPNLHAALVRRNGTILAERYFEGEDWCWGTPLGRRRFDRDSLHDIRSATKSIVALLYGIALKSGTVPAPNAPLYESFDGYDGFNGLPARPDITVEHALSMTLGLQWDESHPYTDARNSEIAMEMSANRYRYVLERPVEKPPGAEWKYNGGATALIGKLIEFGTGKTLREFATDTLFGPIGVDGVEWIEGRHGEAAAASGLRLSALGLEAIGRLILQDGVWNGHEVVPKAWLQQCFAPRADVGGEKDVQYGYQWWLSGNLPIRHPWVSAIGNGGQRLFVVPGLGLTIVTFFGNYDRPDAWQHPIAFYVDFVIPALFGR